MKAFVVGSPDWQNEQAGCSSGAEHPQNDEYFVLKRLQVAGPSTETSDDMDAQVSPRASGSSVVVASEGSVQNSHCVALSGTLQPQYLVASVRSSKHSSESAGS